MHRACLTTENGAIENEFQWIYVLELPDDTAFKLQESEVASLVWKPLDVLRQEYATDQYVPHGDLYYRTVFDALVKAGI